MIAGFFYSLTFQFPETATQDVGPAFMPRVYCGLIVLLGGLLIIQGFRDQSKKEGTERTIGYALATMGFVLLYLILIPYLGFYLSTALFVFALLVFSKVRNKMALISVSLGTPLFIFVVFEKLLKVAIPLGSLFS